ncbi:MAG: hypothetical protein ACTSXJ_09245 [Candidatus Baldrarchaeia archaeon]
MDKPEEDIFKHYREAKKTGITTGSMIHRLRKKRTLISRYLWVLKKVREIQKIKRNL